MQKNLALLAKYFKRLYKPTNNNLRTSSNFENKTEDTTPRYNNDNQSGQFRNQRTMTVAGARETVGSQVVQQNGIQCFNCKGFGHYAKECRKPKRVKDYSEGPYQKKPVSTEQPMENSVSSILVGIIPIYIHLQSYLRTAISNFGLSLVKECECLAQKLSKQTESVNKEVHNNLLKSFSKLEKHSISLELALQQCKEQMKNNSVCKENGSNVFRKEREQYHEIQDLKAQMQDKNIAISELKKLIENCKGKSVETQFNKPSVVRQPNAQRIPKPSVLGKPTPFSNSPEMRSFQTKQSVNKTNVSDGLNCPKHVSHQSPREKVGSNDMVHNYYLEKAKKSAQLQKDKEVNGKPSMIDPARLPNTTNGCKLKPRNWQVSMSSWVSNKDVHLGEHRKQKPFLKFNDLQCPTCKKCLYSANHDECVLEYLSRLNPRASAQNKDAKSHKTTKRYMPVEKSSASKKPERQIPTGHRFSNKKTTTILEKTMNPRSCLRWKPTGRIFSNVRLRWIPTGKLFNSCMDKIKPRSSWQRRLNNTVQASFFIKRRLIAADQASVFMAMTFEQRSSSLILHQITFDHNRSELGIQDNSNENMQVPKRGSKSCSLSKQDSYITTRVGITIPPSHSNAEDNSASLEHSKL
ncbi:integrase, catalytic region, zinc finger, CCHC-type containing protein [Tanacetum coccineum]